MRARKVRADVYERYSQAKHLLATGAVKNRAALARFLGVTRARVTQLLGLDRIAPEVWTWLQGEGATYRAVVSENVLRDLAAKPAEHQLASVKAWCAWVRKDGRRDA